MTNPTRRLFGRSGPTKLDVAVYYAAIGDFMLPHLFGRPVSLVRCPTGKPGDCFFQRHRFLGMPPGIDSFETQTSDEEDRTYLTVATRQGLPRAGAVRGGRVPHLGLPASRPSSGPTGSCSTSTPARASPGARWSRRRCTCAHELAALGLVGFAKTTGGKGVHVVVPVTPKLDWKAVHAATGELAARIAATAPDTFTTVMGPANRRRRIFIDFHRNARSATAVAPYSLRARNNLPASAPLSWEDLEKIDAPEDLNYSSLPGLVAATGDPWAEIDSVRTRPAGAEARQGVSAGGETTWRRGPPGRAT